MHKAHIRIFVKNYLKKMLFLDIEHAGIGGIPPSPPKKFVCFFMLYAWFLKMILLGCNFLLLLGMPPKFTTKISHNLKVSV